MYRNLELAGWLLGSLLLIAPAMAQEISEGSAVEAPFTDVAGDAWANQAILRLSAQHGCVTGYPDGTFRGGQPLTRSEFAASLNACLEMLRGLRGAQSPDLSREIEAFRESMEMLQQDLENL
ncbi:hypothetical protein C7271_23675 [filamentous cyanobacterium CCP5]|nr:hypothetical protein C7271_23675 [filamentous cyanobacterium CCP5]